VITIYYAANSLDANMIKGLLAQYNIKSFIQGEYLQGGMGELPMADLVTVSVVNSHEAEAKKIIAEWQSASIVEEEKNTTPLGDGMNVAS